MTDRQQLKWSVVLPGIPVSSNRGALGWSSVTLIESENHRILVDTGSYGDRALLLEKLGQKGFGPEDITMLFLTHFHFDHVLNLDLFPKAALYLSEAERDYIDQKDFLSVHDPFVPEPFYRFNVDRITSFSGEKCLVPGIRTIPLPGHTPGMTGLLLEQEKVLIAGDGIKNGYEFARDLPPPVFGSKRDALASYRKARDIADIIVPGHDRPFRNRDGEVSAYLDHFFIEVRFVPDPWIPEKIITFSSR